MAVRYELKGHLTLVEGDAPYTGLSPIVEVLSTEEFEALDQIPQEAKEALRDIEHAESSFIEVFSDFTLGSFAVPAKCDTTSAITCLIPSDPDLFAFFVDREHLIFVDDGGFAENILKEIGKSGIMRRMTTAHCLYMFFKNLMLDDLVWLGRLEDSMESLEEDMLTNREAITPKIIMGFRRLSMRFLTYYQQLASMASMLADNENKILPKEEAVAFDHASSLADRLVDRAETISEYSGQLRELYQTRVDLRQNAIMQILTVVTVLFAPLTLITGWFGMNLNVLPGIGWSPMWIALIAFFLVCTIALLAFFQRKSFLLKVIK
ncbi:MAG: magnesium transporter CorA [Eggerthellaceae bacterium]|nr:magnesium transporter CorA [Eggerthellaceae bacterium]